MRGAAGDADWVLKRLVEEVEADLADLFSDDGALKSTREWPLIWRQGLVAGLDTNQVVEIEGGKKTSQVFKLRLSDRIRRLELIGKHIGVQAFADRREVSGVGGGPIKVEDGLERHGSGPAHCLGARQGRSRAAAATPAAPLGDIAGLW